MHLTKRPRLLGLCVGIAAVLALVLACHAGNAKAASGNSLTASHLTVTRLASGTTLPQNVLLNVDSFVCLNMTDLPDPTGGCNTGDDDSNSPTLPNGPLPHTPFNGGATNATGKGAPNVPNIGRSVVPAISSPTSTESTTSTTFRRSVAT